MNLIKRIKRSLKSSYYCDCHNKKHWQHQPSIVSLVGAYIGCAIMLDIHNRVLGDEDLEKKYCEMCHP